MLFPGFGYTRSPRVAKVAGEQAAGIINDVSAISSQEMAEIVKKTGCGWVVTFSQPGAEQEAKAFFEKSAEKIADFGIPAEQICFDPGIGFGKTREQDFRLLANIEKYRLAGYPFLLGTSRKRVIGEGSAQPDPNKRGNGNIAAETA